MQQFYSAVGKRAFPRKPDGLTKQEFKQAQLGIGALALQHLIDTGALELNVHLGKYQAEKKEILRKATKKQREQAKAEGRSLVPADAGYVIEINDPLFINDLADAVAIHPNSKPDFKEVYVGDQKPNKQNKFRGIDGLQIIARDLDVNNVTRESHPDVFYVKDKADGTKYVVDKGYLKFLKNLLN